MVEPLATANGTTTHRTTVLVRVITDIGEGWGECVALPEPTYTPEWSSGEYAVLSEFLAPALLAAGDITASDVVRKLSRFKQHQTSKAALELAVLDAGLRAEGRSFASYLGVDVPAIECSVVVGLVDEGALERVVEQRLARGYKQIKLKVKPGFDLRRIDLVARAFPDLKMRVDANGSYDWSNPEHRALLLEMDARDLAFIEQPIESGNARAHIELTRTLTTPIALDESIDSFDHAIDALDLFGCGVFVLKPGVIGGYLTARALHDVCFERKVGTMLGGMVETGVARAANLALAGLPGLSRYPAEISPDGRWFHESVLQDSVAMEGGMIKVPSGPGIGVELDIATVNRLTRRMHSIRANSR